MTPEWRVLEERDARRRAEADKDDLRREMARKHEREHMVGREHNDGALAAAQQQVAEARTRIEAMQRFQLRADEARMLLLGHGGSALQGSGTDIVGEYPL
jgi:hypothetical protein